MDVDTLRGLLEKAWCAETALGDWNPNIPSLNQCAVTALVVQDFFGGNLMRCRMTNGDSHYWNNIDGLLEYDFTADQFFYIDAKPLKSTTSFRSREYVLSFPNTMYRYGLLLQRLAAVMEG